MKILMSVIQPNGITLLVSICLCGADQNIVSPPLSGMSNTEQFVDSIFVMRPASTPRCFLHVTWCREVSSRSPHARYAVRECRPADR